MQQTNLFESHQFMQNIYAYEVNHSKEEEEKNIYLKQSGGKPNNNYCETN